MSAGHPLLEVRGLSVSFRTSQGVQRAVDDLSFSIHAGQSLALVGESGCGKSTTALALLRLVDPKATVSGQVIFEGRDLNSLSEPQIRSLRGNAVSMIFQEPMTSLSPVHPIGAQIAEAIRAHERCSARQAMQRAVELLELVRIPEPARRAGDFPHQLSGGQRQRVMIAMAVACNPRLLVADEATTALDATVQAQILELLDDLRRSLSMALLLITHDLGIVSQWTDRVAVMYRGKKVEEGVTADVFANPAHAYTRCLLGASLNVAQISAARDGRLAEVRHRIDPVTGLDDFTLFTPPGRPARVAAPAANLLAVRDLHTHHTTRGVNVHAVAGVSFDVAVGETVGLVGESGCGKSTLSRSLIRLLKPSAGQIILGGVDYAKASTPELKPLRQQVQMIFQDPYSSLNPRRSVFDILDTVLYVNGVSSSVRRRSEILTMLDRVGLASGSASRFPHEFSGGQRQRIGIARALILRPSLVICDEPVSALDVSVQAQILNLLSDLKDEFGLSYLFISHDLAVIRYIADRVLVMKDGLIVESGSASQVGEHGQHAYTRELMSAIPGQHAPRSPHVSQPEVQAALG